MALRASYLGSTCPHKERCMASWSLKSDESGDESGVVVRYERGVATVVAALMTEGLPISVNAS
jgi:hypothetical protein